MRLRPTIVARAAARPVGIGESIKAALVDTVTQRRITCSSKAVQQQQKDY